MEMAFSDVLTCANKLGCLAHQIVGRCATRLSPWPFDIHIPSHHETKLSFLADAILSSSIPSHVPNVRLLRTYLGIVLYVRLYADHPFARPMASLIDPGKRDHPDPFLPIKILSSESHAVGRALLFVCTEWHQFGMGSIETGIEMHTYMYLLSMYIDTYSVSEVAFLCCPLLHPPHWGARTHWTLRICGPDGLDLL